MALYDDTIDGHPLAHRAYLDELRAVFDKYELTEVDALAVGGGRWWSYRCQDDALLPAEGTALDDRTGRWPRALSPRGWWHFLGRADLEAELEPDEERMADVLGRCSRWGTRRTTDPTWSSARRTGPLFGASCRDARRGSRSAAARAGGPGALGVDGHRRSGRHRRLPRRAAPSPRSRWPGETSSASLRRSGGRRSPPIYALWCQAGGGGARANIAIEAALTANPDYSMARLLDEAAAAGDQPSRVHCGRGRGLPTRGTTDPAQALTLGQARPTGRLSRTDLRVRWADLHLAR